MRKRWYWILVYPISIAAVLFISVWGGDHIPAFSEGSPIHGNVCIIIDPGHGGPDGGATSCTGILESAYNLEISLKLEELLHLLGHHTKMIRREDVSVYTQGDTIAQKKISDLKERVRIVNETERAVLVSIHQNIFHDSRYSGAQVFYGSIPGSEILANQLQYALINSLDIHNQRQAQKSRGIYLMEHIECIGVLIECGFLSNPQEESMLRDPDYQVKLCAVIATELNTFLSST